METTTLSKILIVDDSLAHSNRSSALLEVENHLKDHYEYVLTASENQSWLHLADGVDLVFLEYSVTDMSGILFYKKMGADPRYSLIPTIFISKTKAYDHRVNAFEMGAADFLTLPLTKERLQEITASHLQNCRRLNSDGSVKVGNMLFTPSSHSVLIDDKKIHLTDLEFKILQYLLVTPRNVISRDEICRHVWGDNMINTGRLDTQLYNLKKKIHAFNGKIKSVNKIGMRVLCGETTFYQEQKKPGLQSLPLQPHL